VILEANILSDYLCLLAFIFIVPLRLAAGTVPLQISPIIGCIAKAVEQWWFRHKAQATRHIGLVFGLASASGC